MVYVTEDVDVPGIVSNIPLSATVTLDLVSGSAGRGFVSSTGKTILSTNSFTLNPVTSKWTYDLTPNSLITNPTGTVYRRVIAGVTDFFDVPTAHKTPLSVTSSVRTSNVVTLTVADTTGYSIGEQVVTDLVNNAYDGLFTLTNVTGTTLVYSQFGADLGTSTGTVGKPWPIGERFTSDPTNLPTTNPSNEEDSFTIAADASSVALTGGFDLVALANTVFTVPDSAQPHLLIASVLLIHSVTGQIAVVCAPVGTTTVVGLTGPGAGYTHVVTASTVVYEAVVHAYFGPHTAGNYQLFGNGPAGNLVVKGSNFAQTRGILLAI